MKKTVLIAAAVCLVFLCSCKSQSSPQQSSQASADPSQTASSAETRTTPDQKAEQTNTQQSEKPLELPMYPVE